MPSRKNAFLARSKGSRSAVRSMTAPGAGHAVVLLVEQAVLVLLDVAGALVGAGEGGADHHAGGARGEVEGHVARLAHAAVGPHVLAERAGPPAAQARTAEKVGRPAPVCIRGRAHGAGADVDLDDVGAGLDERAGALGGADVAGDEGHASADGGAHRADGLDHAALVAVRGVEHDGRDADLAEPRRRGRRAPPRCRAPPPP